MSSITKIQYWQIELSEKWTHGSESRLLKEFYVYRFIRWTKHIWWARENWFFWFYIAFLSKLFKYLQKTIFLSAGLFMQIVTFTIQCMHNLWWIESSPSELKLEIFSAWQYFLLQTATKQKRTNQQFSVNYAVLQRFELSFLLTRAFETLIGKLSIVSKIWKWRTL